MFLIHLIDCLYLKDERLISSAGLAKGTSASAAEHRIAYILNRTSIFKLHEVVQGFVIAEQLFKKWHLMFSVSMT